VCWKDESLVQFPPVIEPVRLVLEIVLSALLLFCNGDLSSPTLMASSSNVLW
jgi:hypothetical protein